MFSVTTFSFNTKAKKESENIVFSFQYLVGASCGIDEYFALD